MQINKDFDREELIALAINDLSRDQIEASLAKLKLAISLDKKIDKAHSLLAKIYAQLKLFDRAIHFFQLYLDHHPSSTQERFELGMVTLDHGEPTSALAIWAPLLIDTNHPPAIFYSAVAYAELDETAAARRQLDILLKSVAPDNLYFNRGKELLASLDNLSANSRANYSSQREASVN
jgi:Tfp pilus assembly protein PilF